MAVDQLTEKIFMLPAPLFPWTLVEVSTRFGEVSLFPSLHRVTHPMSVFCSFHVVTLLGRTITLVGNLAEVLPDAKSLPEQTLFCFPQLYSLNHESDEEKSEQRCQENERNLRDVLAEPRGHSSFDVMILRHVNHPVKNCRSRAS